jgi:hypothetical protein
MEIKMKKLTINLMITLFTLTGFLNNVLSQTPQGIIYQAEARDNKGLPIRNQALDVKISILKDSKSGTVVYEELHKIHTSNDGMFVLVIGQGAMTSGLQFENIEWGKHSHYLNVKVKETKKNLWIDMGTSQLLSVPYALLAKTAENLTGVITEKDPVFNSSPAYKITSGDITKLSNLSGVNTGDQNISAMTHANRAALDAVTGVNTGDQDGSETKVTAGTNISVTGTGTTASPYLITTSGATTLAVGQNYHGGIIFWLDATGLHGLIAATEDQSTGIQWYNGTNRNTGATGDGLYAGAMNTAMIIATQMADNQTGNFAAKACADYSVTVDGVTYGDWYLPSKYELNLLYQQKDVIGGGFGYVWDWRLYWSSTEDDSDGDKFAWTMVVGGYHYGSTNDTGEQWIGSKNDTSKWVRAIRAF